MSRKRYTSVAISLHWLIAILLIGLVAVGKYMNELEETDNLRFELIQWHKSFGILVLLLVAIRIFWRLSHRPPVLLSKMPRWERFAGSATHVILYILMLAIPVSGWIMVSASPLNLKTELFGAIPWPHLPLGLAASDKEFFTDLSLQAHHLLANAMLLLVLLHIAAALKHQFVKKDNLMSRMWVGVEHQRHSDLSHALIPGLLLAGAIGLFLWERAETVEVSGVEVPGVEESSVLAIASVGFVATQLGEPVAGVFETADIILTIDNSNPALSTLTASVQTGSVNTGDGQIDSTVVTSDWFASEQFPDAEFTSTRFERVGDGADAYSVTGNLTIRNISQVVTFPLQIDGAKASGEFKINRADFEIGTGGQDEFIEPEVTIRFETSL